MWLVGVFRALPLILPMVYPWAIVSAVTLQWRHIGFLRLTLPLILLFRQQIVQINNNGSIKDQRDYMITSSNGNIFRVTGPLCGEFTGHRWILLTEASYAELWCFLLSVPWINNREAGDLRCHRAHYAVTIIICNDIYTEWLIKTQDGIQHTFDKNTARHTAHTFVTTTHRWQVDSPHKWPVMWKALPCHDVTMVVIYSVFYLYEANQSSLPVLISYSLFCYSEWNI